MPGATLTMLTWAGTMLTQVAGPLLVGAWMGSERDLIGHLAARVWAAEAERELRAREAVLHERERIAGEMHDSLGHQLALLTVQAGALEVNATAEPDTVSRQAEVIRATARQALLDLRGVVGVLSGPDGATTAPPPSLADVRQLVERSRTAGKVDFAEELTPADAEAPESLARAVHRLVQEGLTNAHRHAPGAPVSLGVTGGPGRGLEITMVNPLGGNGTSSGNGTGLARLAERVRVLGGSFDARVRDGRFVLTARLPWDAAATEDAT